MNFFNRADRILLSSERARRTVTTRYSLRLAERGLGRSEQKKKRPIRADGLALRLRAEMQHLFLPRVFGDVLP
jgi:hypothetical protein